jgi:quinol monooxygenase YgiN
MSKIVAIASLTAAEGRGDEVVDIFRSCIEQSHKEEGCLKYALHRDKSNPDHLVMIEHWRSQDDIDEHGKQPHFLELMQKMGAVKGLFAGAPSLWFTESLEIGDPEKGSL